MSWSRRNDPPPPRAFMGSAEVNVISAISKIAAEQRWMVTREVNIEELRQLYIRPEDREPLKHAFNAVEFNSLDQHLLTKFAVPGDVTTDGSYPNVDYSWDWQRANPDGFFVPKYGNDAEMQPDAPIELVEKYTGIHERLERISREFGLVRYVFGELNKNGFCNTPQQMRFVWPAIRHLVDRFDKKLGNSLIDASSRAGDKARVPAHVVEFMVPTVNIMARSLLLDKIDMNEKRQVTVKWGPATYHAGPGHSYSGVY